MWGIKSLAQLNIIITQHGFNSLNSKCVIDKNNPPTKTTAIINSYLFSRD